jgi:hypothetical protein
MGTVSAKEHQSGGFFGIKPHSDTLGGAVALEGFVEPRMKDHSGYAPYAISWRAERSSLLHGEFRSADEVLVLRLEPEMRRVVGKIRY